MVGRYLWDFNKYGEAEATASARMFHAPIRALVKRRLADAGGNWNSFVFDRSYDLVTAADFDMIEADILATGHRYDISAVISAKEAPEKYKPLAERAALQTTAAVEDGRMMIGHGDNVVRYPKNVRGTARYVRTVEDVMDLMVNGVPPDTVAVIDDSGGTLTAPILEGFKAVICMGGSVRSHLGILTREYGIPCLMNAKIGAIRDGDMLELNVSAPAKSAEDYQKGVEKATEIWKLV